MGSRGPAPQPAELRVLKGNGRDRDVAHKKVRRQPRTVAGAPPMPAGLGADGEWLWEFVTPELARMGILGRVDLATLAAYCRTYHLWRRHDGGHGYSTLTMTLANLGSKLGLDPAARLRMTLPEVPDDEEARVFGSS